MNSRRRKAKKKPDGTKDRVFVSSLAVQNPLGQGKGKFNVKLVGLGTHGQGLIPLGIRTGRIVRSELGREKGLILAEQKSRTFVPKRFLGRAKELEKSSNPVSKFLFGQIPMKTLIKEISKENARNGISYLRELFVKVQRVD